MLPFVYLQVQKQNKKQQQKKTTFEPVKKVFSCTCVNNENLLKTWMQAFEPTLNLFL